MSGALDPGRVDYQSDLALAFNNLAVLARDRGDADLARSYLERAKEHQEKAVEAHPQNPVYRRFLDEHLRLFRELTDADTSRSR